MQTPLTDLTEAHARYLKALAAYTEAAGVCRDRMKELDDARSAHNKADCAKSNAFTEMEKARAAWEKLIGIDRRPGVPV